MQANSQTQRIIVNPASASISVVNSGPMGPRGLVGPSEAATILTVDGHLLTRAAGVLAPITRANLAADTAFTDRYRSVVNHGATAGTTRTTSVSTLWIGSVNPTNAVNNDTLYRTDTTTFFIRIAAAWVQVGAWALPWGEVSYNEITASGPALSTSDVDVVLSTSTAWPTGRKLLVTAMADAGATVSAIDSEIYTKITKADNTILRVSRSFNPTSNTKAMPFLFVQGRFVTTGAAVQYKLRCSVGTGTGQTYPAATYPISLHVVDIGPNTATP